MKPSRTTPCSLTVEFSLVKENILLQSERITQLYVIQSEQDPYLWFGVLFVDSGLYMGAVLRFNMLISEMYPDSPCPKIVFDPIPYHPLVDPRTGELDTKNAFPDWNSNTHKLHQLLLFVKRVICQADVYIKQIQQVIQQHTALGTRDPDRRDDRINLYTSKVMDKLQPQNAELQTQNDNLTGINATEAFNQDLVDLFNNFEHTLSCIRTYVNDPQRFQHLIDQFKERCCHQLFQRSTNLLGDDKNAIIFSQWDTEIHEPFRNYILAGRFAPSNLFASYHKETESVSFVPGLERS